MGSGLWGQRSKQARLGREGKQCQGYLFSLVTGMVFPPGMSSWHTSWKSKNWRGGGGERRKEVRPYCTNGDGTREQPTAFNKRVPLEGPLSLPGPSRLHRRRGLGPSRWCLLRSAAKGRESSCVAKECRKMLHQNLPDTQAGLVSKNPAKSRERQILLLAEPPAQPNTSWASLAAARRVR